MNSHDLIICLFDIFLDGFLFLKSLSFFQSLEWMEMLQCCCLLSTSVAASNENNGAMCILGVLFR